MPLNAVLDVDDLRVMVHLGVGDLERSQPQEVGISLRFSFKNAPLACATDSIESTMDYFKLCELLKKTLTAKPYKTIEHMTGESFAAIENHLEARYPGELSLTLHKLSPPVEGLRGGSRFQISGQL